MIPGIVRNQGEFLVFDRNGAISSLIEHLRRGLDSLDREGRSALGLCILDAVVIYQRECRFLGHNGTEHWLVLIIHSLSAIYQWSTLYGNLTLIICYLAISNHSTHRHIEVDADDIALLDVLNLQDKALFLPTGDKKFKKALDFASRKAVKMQKCQGGVMLFFDAVPTDVDKVVELQF